MKQKKLKGADYLLLLLYLDNKKPIKSLTRLVKMMFLFNKEVVHNIKDNVKLNLLPEFIVYNFGPFSRDVYEQVELFRSLKFIEVASNSRVEEMGAFDNFELAASCDDDKEFEVDPLYIMYEYRIAQNGINYVEQKILPLESNVIDLLTRFKQKITTLTIKQILYYVYNKYPNYINKSLIKDEVLGYGKDNS
ncbi:hypothetical protein [Spiroplasma sp. AdecLV25b]|uniref:hypothetical protein n=1 Tax=Spiroplasma sp. AdecLV25b TaxID=3027162 RepID=UPI0027E04C35|nr:hypothetical protein [Spiroplasma sp. AdecLV25b]